MTKTSAILSLENSYWSLPQILSIVEGGNTNFLEALNKQKPERILERARIWRNSSRSSMMLENETKELNPFAYRYEYCNKVKKYKTNLSSIVAEMCSMYGGETFQNHNTSIIPENEVNNGTSLATFLVLKSQRRNLTKSYTSLLFNNEEQYEPSKKEQKKKKSVRFQGEDDALTNQSSIVSDFFRRISSSHDDYETLQPRSAMKNSILLKQNRKREHHNQFKENKKIDFHELKKSRSTIAEEKSSNESHRNYYSQRMKAKKRSLRHSNVDAIVVWDYKCSIGESRRIENSATKRGSIDSMTNPLIAVDHV